MLVKIPWVQRNTPFIVIFFFCHPVYSGRQTTPFDWYVNAPTGVTQEEGYTCVLFYFFIHLPSAVLALIFYREKDSAVPFPRRPWSRILCTHDIIVLHLLGIMWEKIPVRVTAPRFEFTSQRQKFSRFPTEPLGRPAYVCMVITYTW